MIDNKRKSNQGNGYLTPRLQIPQRRKWANWGLVYKKKHVRVIYNQ